MIVIICFSSFAEFCASSLCFVNRGLIWRPVITLRNEATNQCSLWFYYVVTVHKKEKDCDMLMWRKDKRYPLYHHFVPNDNFPFGRYVLKLLKYRSLMIESPFMVWYYPKLLPRNRAIWRIWRHPKRPTRTYFNLGKGHARCFGRDYFFHVNNWDLLSLVCGLSKYLDMAKMCWWHGRCCAKNEPMQPKL